MKNNYLSLYWNQVDLLLQILPLVAEEECFALKGGTAINLFIQNMPRLSVDIDLTYLPLEPRLESLRGIEFALNNITERILKNYRQFKVEPIITKQDKHLHKLVIVSDSARVKIEPNTILRGTLLPPVRLDMNQRAEELFNRALLEIPTISVEEIYAGKICASLDRQHPRDLFDIKILYENGGITPKMLDVFVAYLASSTRPIAEMLNPNLLDQRLAYETDFSGMTDKEVSYQALDEIRTELIEEVNLKLTNNQRHFLLSIKQGEPDWSLAPFEALQDFPALKWKMINIKKMDPLKHRIAVDVLKKVLEL